MNLQEALASLDHDNDDHWTSNMLPRMDHIHYLTGDDSITRSMVTDAAPELVRGEYEETPEPEGDVMSRPLGEVLASVDLTLAAQKAVDEKLRLKESEKTELEQELVQLRGKSNLLARVAIAQQRGKRADPAKPIKDYLATQKAVREARAKRTQKFVEAGTTAADVAQELSGASKLDSAMKQRRPSLGAGRPAARPMMGR